ncbi:MAG: hypothetical protein ACE5JI_14010 [Acidobacteriota bacterium]
MWIRRELLPYYVSRALLSVGFSWLVAGPTSTTLWLSLTFFAAFVWYAHSGWFLVDTTRPLAPLRPDERAREIQRQALVAAVVVGFLSHGVLTASGHSALLPFEPGPLALSLGVVSYFVTEFIQFARM